MNRTERRRQAKLAKRLPNRSAIKYNNFLTIESGAFDTIERLFIAVRHGALEWGPDGWQIMGLSGEMLHVVSALQGWIKFWQELAEHESLLYDDAALVKFCKSLEYEKPMQMSEVEAAYEVVVLQRRLHRTIPHEVLREVKRKVQAEIATEAEIEKLLKDTYGIS